MIVLISPAKTLDFATPGVAGHHTKPQFHREANRLAAILSEYSASQIRELMGVNRAIAQRTAGFFATWKKKYDCKGAKQAILAYQGDVYRGLNAADFSPGDFEFAQHHLRILSGLYGTLRPLDLIQPYRLEMAAKLACDVHRDLYEYWTDRVTRAISKALDDSSERVVINLASTEYSQVVDFGRLSSRVIIATFKEEREGKIRFFTGPGKQARGMMARYIIRQRIESAEDLTSFRENGYRLNEAMTDEHNFVFTRKFA